MKILVIKNNYIYIDILILKLKPTINKLIVGFVIKK